MALLTSILRAGDTAWGLGNRVTVVGPGLLQSVPIGSMYGIFTYIWLRFMVNVGKYTIHGSYGV